MKNFIFFTTILALLLTTSVNAMMKKTGYYCMPCGNDCDTIAYSGPGTCPHCGMKLYTQPEIENLKRNQQKQIKVAFYLQQGVEVLDFAGPMEVFTAAGFEVFTVSKTKDPVLSQGVLKIIPDYDIKDAPEADILAFFGGGSNNITDDNEVMQWIKGYKRPQYYFSVCTGAFALGKAGLLDGLTATTFHMSIGSLRKACPNTKVLSDVRFVDNGKIMTTAGISAGIDGALHLVAKIKGMSAAKNVTTYMEYDKWVPEQGLIVDKAK
ncbi:DJ-1/PfpI family protein [Mucilaginibacter sp. RS28]|uniref:DJ-1/PfpI family protein n=1 Tax=Mucilaginibacter straminoryzae TaxID=2932774 RepID=A0A9X1X3L5_9SPHI|nr:DJ-1/PfpI family protein [Mucilaginibacter straminoryzae]MCJ8210353.1 DJ-1/PfpI family protein [Mucilaginibacter straminoryzae]